MRHVMCSVIIAMLCWSAAPANDGAQQLFNGKDLSGWDGDHKFWSVEDGAITGRTTPENPTKKNTFLIWKDGKVGDFELRLQFKIIGGNSGVQYRSEHLGDYVVKGYQADIVDDGPYTGILYEEKGRGILANRGEKVVIPPGEKPKVAESLGKPKELGAAVRKGDWNEYVITARGNQLVHEINGVKMSQATDEDPQKRAMEGILALQIHTGPPMTVQFKDIRLKTLSK